RRGAARLASSRRRAPRTSAWISGICLLFAGGVAAADFILPANVILPILYSFPLGLALWARSRALLWSGTLLAVVTTFLAITLGTPPTVPGVMPIVVFNRAMAAA